MAVDLLVVGGGINGAGIARDAAGRGLKVMLIERGDLAGATSSASSKLIHGGLRYLEHYEFSLVRKALAEREVLLAAAPHLVAPLEFVLPQGTGSRPGWMLRIGLFLYDHLGGRKRLPRSRGIDLRKHPAGRPLKDRYRHGFTYADCWTDDARMVVVNAMDAARFGTTVRTRTELVRARRDGGAWSAAIRDVHTGREESVSARILVNAAGPWAADLIEHRLGMGGGKRLRLVKGSHVVVPRPDGADDAYLLQNDDGRVVFVLPFLDRFSLIGTTEVELDAMPDEVAITPDEAGYLCGVVNRYFSRPIAPSDVVWSFAGVRPLVDDADDDPSSVTRDFLIALDAPAGTAPLLSVLGGKITTYRVLAEAAMSELSPFLPGLPGPWTKGVPLPGGDIPRADVAAYLAEVLQDVPWLPPDVTRRLVHTYGSRVQMLLGTARSLADMGQHFGDGVYEAEISYLLQYEWLETVDDFLWRRTKLGLAASDATVGRLRQRLGNAR
ncbi:glycerol-3-phosphate dehydrogenase [Emcibacter sp. SYSU 3D8]